MHERHLLFAFHQPTPPILGILTFSTVGQFDSYKYVITSTSWTCGLRALCFHKVLCASACGFRDRAFSTHASLSCQRKATERCRMWPHQQLSTRTHYHAYRKYSGSLELSHSGHATVVPAHTNAKYGCLTTSEATYNIGCWVLRNNSGILCKCTSYGTVKPCAGV